MALTLTSPAFPHEAMIPKSFTCDGADMSPTLHWTGVPAGTGSFALIMDDPDAPPGTWVHWVLFNIPGHTTRLDESVPKLERLDNGAIHGLGWGVNEFSRVGYYGPCPPPGAPHRYYFKLYALDTSLALPPRATKAQVEAAMQGHVLAHTQMIGRYGR